MRFSELRALLSKRWPFLQPNGPSRERIRRIGIARRQRTALASAGLASGGVDQTAAEVTTAVGHADRRNQLVLAPTTWIEHLTNATRALRSDPTMWLVGLFVTAAALAWFLPIASLGERKASFIDGALVVVGSTAILLYQWRISSTAVQRAEDAKAEQALLRKSFDALQFKLQVMQSNFEVAIADCEDLRHRTVSNRARLPNSHAN